MKFILFFVTVLLLNLSNAVYALPFDPLIGTWKVINDRTNSYISDIVIRKNSKTAQYDAVMVKIHHQTAQANSALCEACQGLLKNQPLFGMQTLQQMKAQSEFQFNQGVWLNTQNGLYYNIKATLSTTKNQLRVTGKSQTSNDTLSMTWIRLQNEE